MRESPDHFNRSIDNTLLQKANRSSYYGHHASLDFDDSRDIAMSATMPKGVNDNILVDKIEQRMKAIVQMRLEIDELKQQKIGQVSSPMRQRTFVDAYDSPQRRTILDSETKTEDSIKLRDNDETAK